MILDMVAGMMTTNCITVVRFLPVFLLFAAQGEFIILRESCVPVPVGELYPQHVLLIVSQL